MPTTKLMKRKGILAENPRAECREIGQPTQGQTPLLAIGVLQLILSSISLPRALRSQLAENEPLMSQRCKRLTSSSQQTPVNPFAHIVVIALRRDGDKLMAGVAGIRKSDPTPLARCHLL